ncbi:MAG: hypothetical protein DDT21_01170 [Syntrophomonadaceae bacterium]|nr:hypothetical protein [Bacillota bacterium]
MRKTLPERIKSWRTTIVLVGLVAMGMLLLLLSARPHGEGIPPRLPETTGETPATPDGSDGYRESLEQELTDLLSLVKGVGKVVVLLTLESGPGGVYGENQETTVRLTREEDGAGGRREVEENTASSEVVVTRDGQSERPLLLMEIKPRLRGVMVIAEGAEEPRLREQLVLALQAGLGAAAHRITVLPMK